MRGPSQVSGVSDSLTPQKLPTGIRLTVAISSSTPNGLLTGTLHGIEYMFPDRAGQQALSEHRAAYPGQGHSITRRTPFRRGGSPCPPSFLTAKPGWYTNRAGTET